MVPEQICDADFQVYGSGKALFTDALTQTRQPRWQICQEGQGAFFPLRKPGILRSGCRIGTVGHFSFFSIERNIEHKTAVLYLNRPDARNAMSWEFWHELPQAVAELEADNDIRCVIIAGRGKSFSTGLDIVDFFTRFKDIVTADSADGRETLRRFILELQAGLRAVADGNKIYIAAVHRHCIGGGLDLISACDLRLASADAKVSLREAKVAIVADMGSLNRLPGIIGMGHTRMMALTGRDFNAAECQSMGLFNEVYPDQEELMTAAHNLAAEIAANPALAVQGTKRVLNYIQDHGVNDSMDYVATFNAAFLDSLDFRELGQAFVEKRKPRFQ
ncbi:MAG: crotonase/enoyl-CoA hydratase family protein [Leptospiraceae bacterium]|nr:crotonase/enoyl-CoA hydratase family protein [Leptospiraceae bacterium]